MVGERGDILIAFYKSSIMVGKFFLGAGIIGSIIASISAMIFGLITVVYSSYDAFLAAQFTEEGAKEFIIAFIEVIDLFLFGTVMLIIGVGLFTLFFGTDLNVPKWLDLSSLESLKSLILEVVVVLIAVIFLGYTAVWDGSWTILAMGGAIALVFAGLGLLIKLTRP